MPVDLIQRIVYACRVSKIKNGWYYRFTEKAFSVSEIEACAALRCCGVDPDVIIDAGANLGQFAFAASEIFPRAEIHSFEPVPEVFRALTDLSKKRPQIKPYPYALNHSCGKSMFHVTDMSVASSLLPLGQAHLEAFPQVHGQAQIEVDVVTVDHIFSTRPGSKILLKMDVQGSELDVLKGATQTLKSVSWVYAECSTQEIYQGGCNFSDLDRYLQTQEFEFVAPLSLHPAWNSQAILAFDMLFRRVGPIA